MKFELFGYLNGLIFILFLFVFLHLYRSEGTAAPNRAVTLLVLLWCAHTKERERGTSCSSSHHFQQGSPVMMLTGSLRGLPLAGASLKERPHTCCTFSPLLSVCGKWGCWNMLRFFFFFFFFNDFSHQVVFCFVFFPTHVWHIPPPFGFKSWKRFCFVLFCLFVSISWPSNRQFSFYFVLAGVF